MRGSLWSVSEDHGLTACGWSDAGAPVAKPGLLPAGPDRGHLLKCGIKETESPQPGRHPRRRLLCWNENLFPLDAAFNAPHPRLHFQSLPG